jgi:hypothetical protein
VRRVAGLCGLGGLCVTLPHGGPAATARLMRLLQRNELRLVIEAAQEVWG